MLRENKQFNNKKIEPEKGQRVFLRSNVSSRCPFLSYNQVEDNEENLNNAFDILFEEISKIK